MKGQCPECHAKVTIRRDGLIRTHKVWIDTKGRVKGKYCKGSYNFPKGKKL